MCSLVITNITGSIDRIASIENFGAEKFGRVNNFASKTGVKSTIPKKTEQIYPTTIAIRIGIVDKNPLNDTEPIMAVKSVIPNIIKSL